MKKLLSLSLALLLLLSLAVPARADVIWEPDNAFYERHRDECTYLDRAYCANSPEGFITLWDAPGGSGVAAQYENGQNLWVYYLYGDWGYASHWSEQGEASGWVPMSDMSLVYDYICFAEDYADRIQPYSGEFADYSGEAQAVHFYKYPGAPGPGTTFDLKQHSEVLGFLTGSGESRSYISSIFVDENGLTWGFVGYLYGRQNSWFCLDDPDGTDFPLRDIPQMELIPAQTPVLPAVSYVPYILVAVVVAVTAGLLFWFYGRRRRGWTQR